MGFKNREIEQKGVLIGAKNMASVVKLLDPFILPKTKKVARGRAEDVYWRAPFDAKADFIRLRRKGEGKKGIYTIKFRDKRNNFNRVEKDNEVKDFNKMLSTLKDVHGAPRRLVFKSYVVYILGSRGGEADTTVSVYRILNDERVFIEIEARTPKKVHFWLKWVSNRLPFKIEPESRSIYELFVQ